MLDEDIPRVSEIVCDGYRWLAERGGYYKKPLNSGPFVGSRIRS